MAEGRAAQMCLGRWLTGALVIAVIRFTEPHRRVLITEAWRSSGETSLSNGPAAPRRPQPFSLLLWTPTRGWGRGDPGGLFLQGVLTVPFVEKRMKPRALGQGTAR